MRTPEQLAALIAQFDNDMATKIKRYRFWLAIDQLEPKMQPELLQSNQNLF